MGCDAGLRAGVLLYPDQNWELLMFFVLDVLAKLTAAAVYRVVQEYRDLEERLEVTSVGLMDDGTLGPDDPYGDVYCKQVGFSAQPGRLKRGD